jgi:hypothetical protein
MVEDQADPDLTRRAPQQRTQGMAQGGSRFAWYGSAGSEMSHRLEQSVIALIRPQPVFLASRLRETLRFLRAIAGPCQAGWSKECRESPAQAGLQPFCKHS